MFESIKFENFKSLRDTTLPLSPFTLIVGPNGSGKSTALNAFSFLNNPGQRQFFESGSVGMPVQSKITLVAKWKEEGNNFLVQVQWGRGTGFTDTNFTAIPPSSGRHDNPLRALNRAGIYSLDAIAIAAPIQLSPDMHQPPLKIALGLAVPAIEAWLLCGLNPHVTEAAWINGMREGRTPYTRPGLKIEVYGTSRPSLEVETEAMKTAASRLAANLNHLESLFPHGFGALQADLRRW